MGTSHNILSAETLKNASKSALDSALDNANEEAIKLDRKDVSKTKKAK